MNKNFNGKTDSAVNKEEVRERLKVLVRGRDLDEVCTILYKELQINPLNVNLLYVLANLYEIQKKYINAYALYKKINCISTGDMEKISKSRIARYENIEKIEKYNRRKKVLIIAYIFPPIGGSGVQRTLKFVKYLMEFHYEPIIVTVSNCKFIPEDDTLFCEVPSDIRIIRIEETDADNRYYKDFVDLYGGIVKDNYLIRQYEVELLKLQDNFKNLAFVTDINAVWAMEVMERIGDIVDFDEVDLIYSTSGPYSDHIIGYYLKEKYGIPWTADFRDEWTNNPYFELNKQSILYKMQRKMEYNILRYSDKIFTVSEMARENYISEFDLDENKIITITNGYDEDDFKSIGKDKRRNDKFTIIFNGSLYLEINPYCFIMAVNQLIHEKKINRKKIDMEFVGKIEKGILDRIIQLDVYKIIAIKDYMAHVDSLKNASRADLLLLIVGSHIKVKSVYTGKIFEYLRLCRYIISLSPKGSLVEKLILGTHRGKNFEINDIGAIKDYILEVYGSWKNNSADPLEVTDEIQKYERKHLTEDLANVFDEVISDFHGNDFDFKEEQSQFYNTVYKRGGWNETYFKHYSETHYFPIWSKSMEIIKGIGNVDILDIGCGAGQFANFVFDNGITSYRGIDFSERAVKIAKIRNDKYRNLFKVDNAYTSDIMDGEYNTVVLFEVLEHLDEDLKLIGRIKAGSNIIFSVPNFYCEGHVRWFNSKIDILKRYTSVIYIYSIYVFNMGKNNKIYLVWGVKSRN